jgi:TUG ubiquitin-like domain
VAVDPAACQLLYNKKTLDAALPVRLANIPSGAKLELRTGVTPEPWCCDA